MCGAQFPYSGCLKKHIRTHAGEKPYKCNVFLAQFAQSGGLKIHIRSHTGENLINVIRVVPSLLSVVP